MKSVARAPPTQPIKQSVSLWVTTANLHLSHGTETSSWRLIITCNCNMFYGCCFYCTAYYYSSKIKHHLLIYQVLEFKHEGFFFNIHWTKPQTTLDLRCPETFKKFKILNKNVGCNVGVKRSGS